MIWSTEFLLLLVQFDKRHAATRLSLPMDHVLWLGNLQQ